MQDDAIIRPKCPGEWPKSPKLAFMIGSPADLSDALSKAGLTRKHGRTFLNSRLYFDPDGPVPLCIAGPFIGAPYAVILLETLIAWGVKQVVFFGWCGSLHADVAIGDLVVPTIAHVADGTSPNYLSSPKNDRISLPSADLNAQILSGCRQKGLACHAGPIWTTDAVFRETPDLINQYKAKGRWRLKWKLPPCLRPVVFAVLKFQQSLRFQTNCTR